MTPITYYATSSYIQVASIRYRKDEKQSSTVEVISTKKFRYDELIDLIGRDKDFSLFTTEDAAREHSRKKIQVVESAEPLTLQSLVSSQGSLTTAMINAMSRMGELSVRPHKIIQKRIILKLTLFDNSQIAPDPDDLEYCAGVLGKLHFNRNSEDDAVTSMHFSKDNNVYLHFIDINSLILTPPKVCEVPSAYKNLMEKATTKVAQAKALIIDYFKPAFGLFLSGHWNRHHLIQARELAIALDSMPNDEAAAFQALIKMRNNLLASANPHGSFMRRMNVAIELLAPSEITPYLRLG